MTIGLSPVATAGLQTRSATWASQVCRSVIACVSHPWLDNRDQWTGFADDLRRARLRMLAGEVAEVVEEPAAALG